MQNQCPSNYPSRAWDLFWAGWVSPEFFDFSCTFWWVVPSVGTGWWWTCAVLTYVKGTAKPDHTHEVPQPSLHLQDWSVIVIYAREHPELWPNPDISISSEEERVRFLLGCTVNGQEAANKSCKKEKFQSDIRKGILLTVRAVQQWNRAQGSCELSILRGVHNLAGQGPEKSDLNRTTLRRRTR